MESKKSSSSRRISETPQSETRPHSSPDPFLRAGNQPKFWQTLSPKNSFAKTSSALNPHALPEYLEGRTPKEKHPFLFRKNWSRANQEKRRKLFCGVASVSSRRRGGSLSFVQRKFARSV